MQYSLLLIIAFINRVGARDGDETSGMCGASAGVVDDLHLLQLRGAKSLLTSLVRTGPVEESDASGPEKFGDHCDETLEYDADGDFEVQGQTCEASTALTTPAPEEETGFCTQEPGTCTCIHAAYPCLAVYKGACMCIGLTDKALCEGAFKGAYCERPESCGENCHICKDSTHCKTCTAGYVLAHGECKNKEELFQSVGMSAAGNFVHLGSPDMYAALEQAYEGSLGKTEAMELVKEGFMHYYEDNFDLILVTPATALDGPHSNAQFFPSYGDRAVLRGIISMKLYENSPSAIPLMHEIEHAWGVFLNDVLPGHLSVSGPHWGMSAMDKRGMLAGFTAAGVTCSSGTLGEEDCVQPLRWDFSQGSSCCSHDNIGGFSQWDLLLMGLVSPAEMTGEKLVFSRHRPALSALASRT
jgi:hypothetical protein